jgi:chemotaxis protein methyltransferase CheR
MLTAAVPVLAGAPSALTGTEFDRICRLAYETAGLDLRHGKEALVSARLQKKIRELRLGSFQEYYRRILEDPTGETLTGMIDALTTNHTSFFRESAHFDLLRATVLPRLRNQDRIAIWSAACSTGEEPYSIAFSVLEELGETAREKLRVLATDISTKVLASAKKGIYLAQRFEEVPSNQLHRYLLRGEKRWKGWYQVKPEVRAMVEFRQQNLMQSLSHLGAFPVIFCRNVMIYFDRPTRQDLVNRLAGCLEPGGYLFIGSSESLNGITHPLQYVQPAVYRRPEEFHANRERGQAQR